MDENVILFLLFPCVYTHIGYMQIAAKKMGMPMIITTMDASVSTNTSDVPVKSTICTTGTTTAVMLDDTTVVDVLDDTTVVDVLDDTTVVDVLDDTAGIAKLFVAKCMISDTASIMFSVESVISIIVAPVILIGMITLVCTTVGIVTTRRKRGSVSNKIDTLEYVVEKAVATSARYSSRTTLLNSVEVIFSVTTNENTTIVEAFGLVVVGPVVVGGVV
jgi:hypothetical protein